VALPFEGIECGAAISEPRFAYTGGYPQSELWLRDGFLD
jgi:hypothetical protein